MVWGCLDFRFWVLGFYGLGWLGFLGFGVQISVDIDRTAWSIAPTPARNNEKRKQMENR